jgi:hypothetical protein
MKEQPRAANRPLKYGEPTQLLQFRVPKSRVTIFKKIVAAILKKWEAKKRT